MTKNLDLTVMTPAEVDAILADLDYERYAAMIRKIELWQAADKARNYVHYYWRSIEVEEEGES